VILLGQGFSRSFAFQGLMMGAVRQGAVHSQGIDDLKTWVESIPERQAKPETAEG
jgi:hypothetical protein